MRVLRALSSPKKLQEFVESLAYNLEEERETAFSPRRVLEERKAHCLEAAVFAACALRFQGRPPLLVDLRAVRDEDHVICVFQSDGRWGSVAKSKFTGLRSRDPVYKSLRELVLSYFEGYYNLAGEKTLREYSIPLDLRCFDSKGWMSRDEIWFISDALEEVRHYKLFGEKCAKNLRRLKGDLFRAGLVGYPKVEKVRHLLK
ncbi:MAG: hypothetical protein HYU64_01500 [Armatimonadetes bacterium]|nr:hypothetical protein [Armatimonadota bacterium]